LAPLQIHTFLTINKNRLHWDIIKYRSIAKQILLFVCAAKSSTEKSTSTQANRNMYDEVEAEEQFFAGQPTNY